MINIIQFNDSTKSHVGAYVHVTISPSRIVKFPFLEPKLDSDMVKGNRKDPISLAFNTGGGEIMQDTAERSHGWK